MYYILKVTSTSLVCVCLRLSMKISHSNTHACMLLYVCVHMYAFACGCIDVCVSEVFFVRCHEYRPVSDGQIIQGQGGADPT